MKITIIISSVILSFLFSCDTKTEDCENELKFIRKIENITSFNVSIRFISNISKSENRTVNINANNIIELSRGSNCFLTTDVISRQVFDSAYIYFGNEYLLIHSLNDTLPNNILNLTSYEENGTYEDRKLLMHKITQLDLNRAIKIK